MFLLSYIIGSFSVVCFVFGVLLIVRRSYDARAVYLALLTISAGVWSIGNALADVGASGKAILGWTMVATAGFTLLTIFFTSFVFCFRQGGVLGWQILLKISLPGVVLFICIFNPFWLELTLRDPVVLGYAPAQATFGILYLLSALVLHALFAYGLVVLFRGRKKASTSYNERQQFLYIVIGGYSALFGSLVFDVLLPLLGENRFYNIGPLSTGIMIGCLTYAIVRHKLLDIRIVIQRGLIYTILFSLIILAYFIALLGLRTFANITGSVAAPLSAIIVMVAGIFSAPVLDAYLRRKTDRIFFKDRYEYSDAIQELSGILNAHNTPNPMLREVLKKLTSLLRIHFAEFVPLSASMEKGMVRIPIASKQKKLGTLILGEKKSGDPYTKEDMHLLNTFSASFAVALEKAEFFEQLQQYSEELEKKVAERTKHLEELQENQKLMIGDISHALQTPLTVLKGALDRIVESPKEVRSCARVMEQSVANVSTFVHDLLKLSRLNALPESIHIRFSMSDLVTRITEYVQTICDSNRITLMVDVSEKVFLHGNEKDIDELITILLSNAVKYTRNSPIAEITTTLRQTKTDVVLSVRDTGIGIPADKLPHIFERFYRAHEAGKERGSGLGLAIAKRITERHGGVIQVESEEGKGSLFTVILPKNQKE